ncbi:DNA-binding protein [Pseudomonas sp. St29]|uniref:DNA-binding protein n=1 Tax=Pseudomonas sp. St29 TaxID=1500687 RepID=UPI0005FC4B52|nr:DNA-binding protein [Pseudomonas sp. St29]BAQ81372.1 cointegrate resolution protein T [Pseudomonas sp. St29]
MARGGINKAVVKKARQAILARGEHPSIDAVRIEMGNTGSKTTIHRYLKELDDGSTRREGGPVALDEELGELVGRLGQRLQEQAREPLEQALAHSEQQKQAFEQQLEQARRTEEQLQQQLQIQASALAGESAALQDTRSMLQSEQTRNAELNQALKDYDLRLEDKEQQIRSLEDKHLHARDALEHYRAASKEQREQEHRRHEGQLQQLQAELRQAQQSALVRQDEITQLHRDNERLLGEQRASHKELVQAQEAASKGATQQAQLREQLTRLDSASTLLQERLRVASEEMQALRERADEQTRLSKEMELRAAKAEAGLEALRLASASKAKAGKKADS